LANQDLPGVADVIGAGDALCAGMLSGLLDGLDPVAALRRGPGWPGAVSHQRVTGRVCRSGPSSQRS